MTTPRRLCLPHRGRPEKAHRKGSCLPFTFLHALDTLPDTLGGEGLDLMPEPGAPPVLLPAPLPTELALEKGVEQGTDLAAWPLPSMLPLSLAHRQRSEPHFTVLGVTHAQD